MNLKDILSADLPTVMQWVRRGFAWWTEELSHSLPQSWRKRLYSAQPDVTVELGEKRVSYKGKNGSQIDPAVLSGRDRRNVKLVVPLKLVLTRVLEFPLLPMSDIRRIVSLEIDRLTPFRAETVYFDTELIRRDTEKSRQQILLGVIPRASAAEAVARAEHLNLIPIAFGAAGAAGSNVHFDFLPALRGGGSLLRARTRVPYWWGIVAFLMALNLVLISYRDSAQLNSLQQIVDSQAGPVAVAMRLRASVEDEAARRIAFIEHLKKSSPLRILDAVTRALPPNAWTQTLEWNGQTVHLVGYSNGPADILRALESSPSLHNARIMSRDAIPVKQGGMQPFDVAADAGKRPVR